RFTAPLNVTVPTRSALLRVPAFWLVMVQLLSASEATREIGPLGLPITLTGLPVVSALTVAPPMPVRTVTVFVSAYLYWVGAGANAVMLPNAEPLIVTVSRVTVGVVPSAESSTLSVVKEGGLLMVSAPMIAWTLPALPTLTVSCP